MRKHHIDSKRNHAAKETPLLDLMFQSHAKQTVIEVLEKQIKKLEEKEIIKCYNCDYKGKMTSLGYICPECNCDN